MTIRSWRAGKGSPFKPNQPNQPNQTKPMKSITLLITSLFGKKNMKPVIYALAAAIIMPIPLRGEGFAVQLKAMPLATPAQDIQKFVKDSYEANKNDPAYYVASANYWWNLSLAPNISTKPSEKNDSGVSDPKTGKEVGSISTEGRVNPQVPDNAVQLLREALKRFPNRIDIGMGLAYMLRELDKQKDGLDVLLQVLRNAEKNPTELQWKNGEPLPAPPKTYIPELMQGYTGSFYRLETKEGDALCHSLCEAIIQTYPDHPYAYNILAALCRGNKDDQGCAKYLLIACEKAPNDSIVMLNLASTYRRLGNKKEAKRYYKLALASKPSEDIKAEAESALREINK
jgi:tetratricopeptide (TPR) repeat protein